MKSLFIAGLLLAATLFNGAGVHALEDSSRVSISATPSIVDIGGNPGSKVHFSFSITNRSQLVLPFHLSARTMLGMDGEVESFLQTNNAEQWVSFDEPDFLIDAGKNRSVSGTLTIPTDVGPEGFYADIVVKPLGTLGAQGTIHAQPEIVVRLLARVSGKAVEKVESNIEGGQLVITRRSSGKKLFFNLKNTGNVHELIRPMLHMTKGTSDVSLKYSEAMLLLPRETKRVSFDIPDNATGGTYDAKLEYAYGVPLKKVANPGYRLMVLPFNPIVLLLLPTALLVFAFWRYRTRLQRALAILAKGDKAGK